MNYTKKLQELQAELDALVSRNEEIMAAVEAEGRNSLTEEERNEIDNNVDVRKPVLLADIKRYKALKAESEERAQRAVGDASAKPNTPKEVRKYKFGEAIKDLIAHGKPTGLYAEMHQEAQKDAAENGQYGKTEARGGLSIPNVVLRDSTAGVTTEGGHTVQTTIAGSFIEALVNATVMNQLGAQFMTDLRGNLKFPRVTTPPSATWEGETDLAAETNVTWDSLTLTPNRLSGYVQISKQLTKQSEYMFENVVRAELIAAFQRALDNAAINGTGAGGQPTGILTATGTTDVAMGTNGAAITYAKLVEFETSQGAANGTNRNISFLTNNKVMGDLKTISKDSGSGRFLYNDSLPSNPLLGYPLAITNAVPSNLTKGTGTNLSAMIYGDFNEVMIGQWGGIDVLYDPYSSAKNGLIDIVVDMFGDVQIRHAASFAISEDIITTV